jgi:hypothetical protein
MQSGTDLLRGAAYMVTAGLSVWLPCWGLRRKYELDYKLDRFAQYARCSILALCLIVIDFQIVPPGNWAAVIGVIFLGFLAWPNFTYHIGSPVAAVSRSSA